MKKLTDKDGEVREITEDDIKHFKPARDVMPEMVEALKRGRPRQEVTKERLTVRLDPDIVAWLKAQGTGYQTRMNDLLRDIMEKSNR